MHTGPIVAAVAVAATAGLAGTAHAVTVGGPRPTAVVHVTNRFTKAAGHQVESHSSTPRAACSATSPVTNVTATSATLNGCITSFNWPVTYWFNYGTTTSYGEQVPSPPGTLSGSGYAAQAVSQQVTGLTPGTTYHFDLQATYNNVSSTSQDYSFNTLTAPLPTAPTTTTSTTPTTPTTPTTTPSPSTPTTTAPTPVVQQTAIVEASSGTVSVTEPGSPTPVALSAATSLPLGAVIDASHGVATVTNALADGRTQSVTVWAGRFTMTQNRFGRTWFHLVGVPACSAGSHAHAARKPPVTLWAHDHHGRYGTRGNNSVATVRGTVWETIESCAGTRTVVRRGVVNVLDLHTHRSVLVHAGHSVLVRP